MKIIFHIFIMLLPWKIRRFLLELFFDYQIHPTARIGKSIILADRLRMDSGASIGHFVFCKNIDNLCLKEFSCVCSFNYITGFNSKKYSHFGHVIDRCCELVLESNTSVTSRHFFDCNGGIYIGEYTTVAGLRTTFLTHSIDVYKNRQNAESITIGKYCFIGTGCILLPGSSLPDYSILGAGAVLTSKENESGLYGGNPARYIKKIDIPNTQYFQRTKREVF